MAKDCIVELKSKAPDLHKYLEGRVGAYTDATKESWRKAAQELQHETLNNLQNIYADLKVPGYERGGDVEIGDEVDTPNGKGVIDKINSKGAATVKLEDGSKIMYTPNLWKGAKEDKTTTTQSETTEVSTIEDAKKKYDEVENYTFDDMVNDIEGIANDSDNKKLIDAVDKYRKEQEDDRKLGGRGDMDAAQKEFEQSLKETGSVGVGGDVKYTEEQTQEYKQRGFEQNDNGIWVHKGTNTVVKKVLNGWIGKLFAANGGTHAGNIHKEGSGIAGSLGKFNFKTGKTPFLDLVFGKDKTDSDYFVTLSHEMGHDVFERLTPEEKAIIEKNQNLTDSAKAHKENRDNKGELENNASDAEESWSDYVSAFLAKKLFGVATEEYNAIPKEILPILEANVKIPKEVLSELGAEQSLKETTIAGPSPTPTPTKQKIKVTPVIQEIAKEFNLSLEDAAKLHNIVETSETEQEYIERAELFFRDLGIDASTGLPFVGSFSFGRGDRKAEGFEKIEEALTTFGEAVESRLAIHYETPLRRTVGTAVDAMKKEGVVKWEARTKNQESNRLGDKMFSDPDGRLLTGQESLYEILTGEGYSDNQRGMAAAYVIAQRLSSAKTISNRNTLHDFNSRLFELAGTNVVIENNSHKNSILMTASRNGVITLNAKLGKRLMEYVKHGGGEQSFLRWVELALNEEVLHLATFNVTNKAELELIYDNMTKEERDLVMEIYSQDKGASFITKDSNGNEVVNKMSVAAEYLRMILQERILGKIISNNTLGKRGIVTEMLKPGMEKKEVKTYFAKLLTYLRRTFAGTTNTQAKEVIKRIEDYIKNGRSVREIPEVEVIQENIREVRYQGRSIHMQFKNGTWYKVARDAKGEWQEVIDPFSGSSYLGSNEKDAVNAIKNSTDMLGASQTGSERAGGFRNALIDDDVNELKELGKDIDNIKTFEDLRKGYVKVIGGLIRKDESVDYLNTSQTGSERGQIGVNKQQLLLLLGPTMYNKPLAQVAVKELLQNSFDAIKLVENINNIQKATGLTFEDAEKVLIDEKGSVENAIQVANKEMTPGKRGYPDQDVENYVGKIFISIDHTKRTVRLEDNGRGMTPGIIKNAFLSIGGTNKEGLDVSQRSGGFGLAKVQFLLGSESVKVETVRDGQKTIVDATNIELYNDDFDIRKESTDEQNGTSVEIKIPSTYKTLEGQERSIDFPSSYQEHRAFSILTKPLIGNLEIFFKQGGAAFKALPLGINSDETILPPIFSKISFGWGNADLYMSTEKKEYPTHRILSSGIYQFDHPFAFRDYERIPYDIVVDIKPSVGSTSEQYPFNNQREDFKNTIASDVLALGRYLKVYASGEAEQEAKDIFSNITGLPKSDPNEVLTPEEREKIYADIDKKVEENKERRIKEGRESAESEARSFTITINSGIVKDEKGREIAPEENEKKYEESFKADKELKEIPPIEISSFNPESPQYHNNTTVDFLKIPGAAEFFSDFGSVVLDMVRFVGNELGYSYEKLRSSDERKFFAGVSIDKTYGGVHIRKLLNAIFINPLSFSPSNLEAAVGIALHATIHEINHTTASGEGSGFTTDLASLYQNIYGTGKYGLYEGLFRSVYRKHFETFKTLKNEYDKSTTKNLSQSFEGSSLGERSAGAVPGDGTNVRQGQSTEGGRQGDTGDNQGAEKTGDVILATISTLGASQGSGMNPKARKLWQAAQEEKLRKEVEQAAKDIKDGKIDYADAVEGKSQDFLEQLAAVINQKLDSSDFRSHVRMLRDAGYSSEDITASLDSRKKLTKAEKEIIEDEFKNTYENDPDIIALKEDLVALQAGQMLDGEWIAGRRPKSVAKRLLTSRYSHLVKFMKELSYEKVTNDQMEAIVDRILSNMDIKDAIKYIETMHDNALADIKQIFRAKLIVKLGKDKTGGNIKAARQIIEEMATEATSMGRQTQSLNRAYQILKAHGSPAVKSEFAKKYVEAVNKKAEEKIAAVLGDVKAMEEKRAELSKKIHAESLKTKDARKLQKLLDKLCGARTKKK